MNAAVVAVLAMIPATLTAATEALDIGVLLTYYGAAAPLVAWLIWSNRREAARADRWEGLYLALAEKSSNEVVPLLRRSQELHEQQANALVDLAKVPKADPALLLEADRALRASIQKWWESRGT